MNPLRTLVRWLRGGGSDPVAKTTADAVRYEEETNKTAAFDAPAGARGIKWRA